VQNPGGRERNDDDSKPGKSPTNQGGAAIGPFFVLSRRGRNPRLLATIIEGFGLAPHNLQRVIDANLPDIRIPARIYEHNV
jgi:hypothetical protein